MQYAFLRMVDPCVIFLAEDNPADVSLLRIALARNSVECELTLYGDGIAALLGIERAEAGQTPRPDLFLIDYHLSRLDGIALLRRIRQSEVFGKTPVVLWTSSESPADRERSVEGGANGHWFKPETLAPFLALGGMLKELLENRANPEDDAVRRSS